MPLPNRRVLAALQSEIDAIEAKIGQALTWDGEGSARKCAVVAVRSLVAGENSGQSAAWAADQLVRFRETFGPRFEQAVRAAEDSGAM